MTKLVSSITGIQIWHSSYGKEKKLSVIICLHDMSQSLVPDVTSDT